MQQVSKICARRAPGQCGRASAIAPLCGHKAPWLPKRIALRASGDRGSAGHDPYASEVTGQNGFGRRYPGSAGSGRGLRRRRDRSKPRQAAPDRRAGIPFRRRSSAARAADAAGETARSPAGVPRAALVAPRERAAGPRAEERNRRNRTPRCRHAPGRPAGRGPRRRRWHGGNGAKDRA